MAEKKILEGRGIKVLLVDDDETMRGIHRLVLNAIGIEKVDEAENGLEAFDLIGDDDDIDLVLADLRMPVMDGIELLKRLNEQGNEKQVPIIMCSCVADKHMIVEAVKLGAKDYILKPCYHEDLQEKIVAVLKREGKLHKRNESE